MITIERFVDFEERFSIVIENTSLRDVGDGWFNFLCELKPVSGNEIDVSLDIICVAYDVKGGILAKESLYIDNDDFFGFEVLEFAFQEDGLFDEVDIIKIYPKKA